MPVALALAVGDCVKLASTALFAGLFAVASVAHSQTADAKASDLKATLSAVSERGHALYDYDQAAWNGTDAIFALHPEIKGLTHYICVHTMTGWKVLFPKWNTAHDRVLIAFEATEMGGKFTARKIDPPVEADKDIQARSIALELAIHDFQHPNRPYNTAILDAPGGNYYVYLYPGQIQDKVWPIGGDVRYTISGDGEKILDKRQLHKTILDASPKANSEEVAGYHFHILTDVPEDTDVLYVLSRKPSMPEYIGVGKQVFVVKPDGSIEQGVAKQVAAAK